MSAAEVTFETAEREPAAPGQEAYYYFRCPQTARRCGPIAIRGRTGRSHDPQGKNGGQAQWGWDGNLLKPTFEPSINCLGCWHGFIRKGRCVDAQGNEEPG